MLSALKNIIYVGAIYILFSCNGGEKLLSYSVADIASKDAREIEELGSFYVTGMVNGKINLGFIKAFKLVDTKDENQAIYVISNYKSLPSNQQESNLKVKLYHEISLNEAEFLIFEESKY